MKPTTVLLVDDVETNRKLLRVILQGEGLNVFEAADGLEALALLERQPVDAIVSDILMPNMDGYRLCHEIRNDDHFYALPFIFYTSTYLAASDEKLALEMGADRFLKKPSSVETIVQTLNDVMAQRRPEEPRALSPLKELEVMQQYSQALITKLEQKNMELQEAITKSEGAEKEIRKLNKDLEQRVLARTVELQKMVNLMSGREVRMAELKKILGQLRAQLMAAGLTPVADDPLSVKEEA